MKYLVPLMLALAVCLGGCGDMPDTETIKEKEAKSVEMRTPPPVRYDEK